MLQAAERTGHEQAVSAQPASRLRPAQPPSSPLPPPPPPPRCPCCRSGEEQRFLEARQAYRKGKTVMSDADYDALKARLVAASSSIFAPRGEGPSCTIGAPGQRGQQAGEAQVDYLKMLALQLPPPLAVSAAGVRAAPAGWCARGRLLRSAAGCWVLGAKRLGAQVHCIARGGGMGEAAPQLSTSHQPPATSQPTEPCCPSPLPCVFLVAPSAGCRFWAPCWLWTC